MQKFSFPKMQNRQLLFSPKIQYKLAAERSGAASKSLRFSKMWSILKVVRTVFVPQNSEIAAPPHQ